ncbi:MAG: hypothetical protein IJ190_07245 [Prevotella sp.]|nr:hypothetical protein [Prevotella sp.]
MKYGNNNNEKAQSAFWKDFLYPIIIGEGNDDWRNRALVIEIDKDEPSR